MSSPRSRSWFDVDQVGAVTVVRFTCAAIRDQSMVQALNEQLLHLVGQAEPPRLLLNFRAIDYLSSAMLAKLIRLQQKIQAANGRLALCEIDPALYPVFEVARLDRLFAIHGNEAEALEALT